MDSREVDFIREVGGDSCFSERYRKNIGFGRKFACQTQVICIATNASLVMKFSALPRYAFEASVFSYMASIATEPIDLDSLPMVCP